MFILSDSHLISLNCANESLSFCRGSETMQSGHEAGPWTSISSAFQNEGAIFTAHMPSCCYQDQLFFPSVVHCGPRPKVLWHMSNGLKHV